MNELTVQLSGEVVVEALHASELRELAVCRDCRLYSTRRRHDESRTSNTACPVTADFSHASDEDSVYVPFVRDNDGLTLTEAKVV